MSIINNCNQISVNEQKINLIMYTYNPDYHGGDQLIKEAATAATMNHAPRVVPATAIPSPRHPGEPTRPSRCAARLDPHPPA